MSLSVDCWYGDCVVACGSLARVVVCCCVYVCVACCCLLFIGRCSLFDGAVCVVGYV